MPTAPASTPQQTQTNVSLEQEQLNNFLGPVNGALGGLPVVERTSEYFVVYESAGGTGPEIIDETAIFITYLVDENGNVSKPSEDYDSLNNLLQNFEVGKNVIIRNGVASAVNGQIAGKQKVTAIGRQAPLLYSQTGSTAGANVNTLNFDNNLSNATVPRALFWLNRGPATIGNGPNNFTYNNTFQEPESTVATADPDAGTYTAEALDTAPTNTIQNVVFSIDVELESWNDESVSGEIQLTKDGIVTGPTLPFSLEEAPATGVPYVEQFSHTISIDREDLANGVFKAQITMNLPNGDESQLQINYLNFRISSQTPETTAPATNLPFWNKDPNFFNSDNFWITASDEISLNYGNIQNSQNVLDSIEPGFNFSPVITPFLPRPGDRIRFGYNPENDYTIYEVIEPSQDIDGRLKLRLNSILPYDLNLNSFVLHRVDSNDPAYIIVDVPKQNLVTNNNLFKGVLLPEYPTKKLKNNLDQIILGLKEKGILPNET